MVRSIARSTRVDPPSELSDASKTTLAAPRPFLSAPAPSRTMTFFVLSRDLIFNSPENSNFTGPAEMVTSPSY